MHPGSGQRVTETRLNPARAPGRGAARPEPRPPAGAPQAPASLPGASPAPFPDSRSAATPALRGHRPEWGAGAARPALAPPPRSCSGRKVPAGLSPRAPRPRALESQAVGRRPRLAHRLGWSLRPPQDRGANPPQQASARPPCGRFLGPLGGFLEGLGQAPPSSAPRGRALCCVCSGAALTASAGAMGSLLASVFLLRQPRRAGRRGTVWGGRRRPVLPGLSARWLPSTQPAPWALGRTSACWVFFLFRRSLEWRVPPRKPWRPEPPPNGSVLHQGLKPRGRKGEGAALVFTSGSNTD